MGGSYVYIIYKAMRHNTLLHSQGQHHDLCSFLKRDQYPFLQDVI